MESPPIRRALVSVSDKSGLTEFAKSLAKHDIEIYSTGGTRRHLEEAGVTVHDVSAYTKFPEMMGGRLKTLHPKLFGGILVRRSNADDLKVLQEHGILSFELVVVNLYPFEQTIARTGVTDAEAIEQIDIGGPSLVRAAAKNHASTTIATNPDQYATILHEIAASNGTTLATRRQLAAVAFERTATYDRAIADYFIAAKRKSARGESFDEIERIFPDKLTTTWQRQASLRYGENPHQRAALYRDPEDTGPSLLTAKQLNGKELSYNNYLDLDVAWSIVRGLDRPAVSVIKHNNPCGAACGDTVTEAAKAALAGDPVSAFGSVLGCNREVDSDMAECLCKPGLFVEAIVAPKFSQQAIDVLTSKPKWKKNVRLMQLGNQPDTTARQALRQIGGGLLVQDADNLPDLREDWTVATKNAPTDSQIAELRFAWQLVRHVKSNAIVLTRHQSLVGAGAGQMSRVDSVEIAVRKAGDRCHGSVLASDAFFPFPDSIHAAAKAGVSAIIQPGGSKRDGEVTAACDELGMPMVLTGRRHFRH